MRVKIKKIDLSSHQYADSVHYRPHDSEWLKALTDFKAGYMQAVKDFKLETVDELGNCHGTSMNRIETLEWELKNEKEAVSRLKETIKQLQRS